MTTPPEIKEAQAVAYRHMAPTPAIEWPLLSDQVGVSAVVKQENCTE